MYYYGFFFNEIANFFPIQNDISCKLFSNSGLDSICSDCAWLCYKTYIQHHLLGKGRQQWTQKSWKQHFDQACWVINQTEIVKLASGIFFCIFCLLSGTSYLSEPTSTEAGTADKLFVSHFSELLVALCTSNWTLIFNANTRPVLFQNYSTPSLWFFKPWFFKPWLWFLFTFPWLCWLLTISDHPQICGLSTRLGTLHWKYSPYSFIHEIIRYNGFDSLERICQFLLRDMLWYSTNIQQSSLWDLI